jgi:hypothetical protein
MEVCWIGFLGNVVSAWRNGFYIKFLAITADLFGHLPAATVLAPTPVPLIALALAVQLVHVQSIRLHSHRGTQVPPPPCAQEQDRRTRGRDSHVLRGRGSGPSALGRILSRSLGRTPRRHTTQAML